MIDVSDSISPFLKKISRNNLQFNILIFPHLCTLIKQLIPLSNIKMFPDFRIGLFFYIDLYLPIGIYYCIRRYLFCFLNISNWTMEKKYSVLMILSFAFSLTSFISLSSQDQQEKITGTWNFTVETSAGSGSPVFVFNQETETSFTGTYKGQLGESPVKGTINGKEVKFSFTVNDNLIEYSGTREGNSMKGTVKLGSMAEGTFQATRKE